MMTSALEKLVLEGTAIVKNFAGGYSAIYSIPCPESQFIVLLGMSVTCPRSVLNSEVDMYLTIEGGKGVNSFIFRPENADGSTGGSIPSSTKIDTYILSNTDLRFRFTIGVVASFVTDFVACPPVAQEPNPPAGYNGQNIVTSVDLGGSYIYRPQGLKYTAGGINPVSTEQAFSGVNGATVMGQPAAFYDGLIFNATYVVVNRAYTNKMTSA